MIFGTLNQWAMGSFYTNIALRDVEWEEVIRVLRKARRRAFVSPSLRGVTVVYDAKCEQQDSLDLARLTRRLSKELGCTAWGVLNHDDDILWYVLASDGEYVDCYNSAPDYFDDTPDPEAPEGGDSKLLTRCWGREKSARKVRSILRKPDTDDAFVFAMDRHEVLAKALGIPFPLVRVGYDYLRAGDVDGVDVAKFVRIGK